MKYINAAATIAAIGFAGIASAQTPTLDLTPSGITLRAGVAIPLDSTLTNVGSSLVNIGAEYQLIQPLIKGGETYLSLDYFTAKLGGDRGTVFPLTINQRVYAGNTGGRRSYYFVGVGAAFIDVNTSGTALALRGGVGTELSRHIIAEISGLVTDRAAGARGNALTFNLGYRF